MLHSVFITRLEYTKYSPSSIHDYTIIVLIICSPGRGACTACAGFAAVLFYAVYTTYVVYYA